MSAKIIKKRQSEKLEKYLFWLIIAILIILSYLIVKPFIIALFSAFILAYLIKPVYDPLSKKVGESLAAIVCIVLILLIIFIPLAAITNEVINQASESINQGNVSVLLEKLESLPLIDKINLDLNELKNNALEFLINSLSSTISYLSTLVLTLIILIFGIYYMLTKWDVFLRELKNYLPFENKNRISAGIAKVTKNLIYGALLLAIVQAVVAGIGFYILGIKFYLLLGALVFFMSIILDTMVVWIPLAIYYLLIQNYFALIGVLIIGAIIFFLGNVVASKVLGDKAKINPLIMLLGTIGGISIFGILGFIIGPMIIVYTIKILHEAIK